MLARKRSIAAMMSSVERGELEVLLVEVALIAAAPVVVPLTVRVALTAFKVLEFVLVVVVVVVVVVFTTRGLYIAV